jgi:hypothetical protein
MTFAESIENAVQNALTAASPYMASRAEVCDSIRPVITRLQSMPYDDAVAYIRASFAHTGHMALAVRMFKNQD